MMTELSEERIVRNLVEALHRLQEDLDRVELWTAALSVFQKPAPCYGLDDAYRLPTREHPPR
jgi:hypothetical protein